MRTCGEWALRISEAMGRQFLQSGDARVCEPGTAAFNPSIESAIDNSSVILLPAGSLLNAATDKPQFRAAGPLWPLASGSTSASVRLEAIVFGSREPMFLALSIAFVGGLPDSERKASDTPGEAPELEVRVAAWPIHPATAEEQVARIPNGVPETRYLPASVAEGLADSVHVALQAHNSAAQASLAAAPIAYPVATATLEELPIAPATPVMASAAARLSYAALDLPGRSISADTYTLTSVLHVPALEMALATDTPQNPVAEVPGRPMSMAGWQRGLAPEAAARFVFPIAEVAPSLVAHDNAPLNFPVIGVKPKPRSVVAFRPTPAAEPAARWVQTVVAAEIAAPLPVNAPQIAALTLVPLYEPEVTLGCVPIPAAEPAARWVQPVVAAEMAAPLPVNAPQIAALSLVPLYEPTVVLGSVPVPAAEPAARFVQPAVAEAQIATIECTMPALDVAVGTPELPFIVRWMEPAAAELVEKKAVPHWASSLMAFHTKLALPDRVDEIGSEGGASGPAASPSADPVESMPQIPGFQAKPVAPAPDFAAAAPVIPFPNRTEFAPRPFQPLTPAAYHSQVAGPNAGGARLVPISTLSVQAPVEQPLERKASIPAPGLLPMEYFCQRLRSVPQTTLEWTSGRIQPSTIPFSMHPVQERLEDQIKKPERRPEPAKVVTLPQAKVRSTTLGLDRTAKIAACLLAAAFLWLGFRSSLSLSSGGQNTGIGSASDVSSITASARGAEKVPAAATGTMAKVRRAIANRASLEMTDSFRNGMENWGTATKSWASGWSRHADGYVRTGELALFAPSASFKDYRLEFYGQVESKSMGWVVRAKDKQNYYTMKLTVLEPGLRPILALVSYPVVGGKPGHKLTTPLSAMVHNRQAYHVAVDVRGSRFTTSIEGEQVNSFTDNALAQGGIGFFSEAGERARLYWMKVSKNQDWLGRICWMIAGDEAGAPITAEFWGPQVPPQKPAPSRPQPVEAVLAAIVTGSDNFNPERAKINKQERKNQWIS